jgi:hypothetical protein
MTKHPRDEDLLGLALGEGAAEDRAHAAACEACGQRLAELGEGLMLAREAELPEPSPLYWDALCRNVAARIAEEPAPSGWFARLQPALAGLAVAASLAGAILIGGRGPVAAPAAATLPAWSALPPRADDAGLLALEGAIGSGETSLTGCDGLARCLATLTDDETRALAAAVREELRTAS